MAVTVIKRPQGHILDTTREDALVTDDYGNQGALFDNPSHGLVDGDYIYVESDIENYNGFWYVEQINSRFFWLREYATGSLLQWVVDATIYYYKAVSTHGWSCVHLPIVYKLSNNRWPTNSIDTARTISSVVDSNGYCALSLSGDIKSSGSANVLDYIKVTSGALAGVYQIIEYTSDTSFTINALYSAANDTALTSAGIQYYYNNYNVRVRVFAGLSSSHYWEDQKAYEQIVDLKLVPDSNGLVTVNINEYLKKQVEVISNNLLLATLPNDIDSFCQFYISTAETYDETDGETQTTSTASFTADSSNFEGVAVNSMLQFKNQYSGYLSEYIAHNSRSKFLTLFEEPRLFIGCYFDISFLLPVSAAMKTKLETYKNRVLQATSIEAVDNYDLGLYRKEISLPSGSLEDRVDISLLFSNDNSGASTFQSTITTIDGSNTEELDWFLPADEATGLTYTYTLTLTAPATNPDKALVNITYTYLDGTTETVAVHERTSTGTTNGGPTALPTPSKDVVKIELLAQVLELSANLGSKTATVTIAGLSDSDLEFSETKTINIDTECYNWDIYLTWKNYLGGMDYWKFTSGKEYIADVESTTESKTNIMPTWPNSYGAFADTLDKETSRTSRDKILVRSQNVTEDEMNAIRYIVSSPLVQIIVSKSDRRTVKVNAGSFVLKRDEDKLYSIEFEISYTNTIPSQSL